ncbi:hypothetical protein FEM48_Zijuj06G0174900 [Ziziphus jujuba var. spinosa]|uniref:Uncharacterized protein n=1 Tax=Ziziphus jujuba var. spinosa TaxID=714518 RepID=A0A978VAM7_ZIZJJ|nr:hypothetical protein FEM48_Zijuj06G0174900 [Ziziphus jujuba var. spinosa]
MSTMRELENNKKKKTIIEAKDISWQEKKCLADQQEVALYEDIQNLTTWTNMIDSMNDKQLKDYLENRPEELKTTKIPKTNPHHNLKHKKVGKSKSSTSSGIMASVWKFHKEDDDQH